MPTDMILTELYRLGAIGRRMAHDPSSYYTEDLIDWLVDVEKVSRGLLSWCDEKIHELERIHDETRIKRLENLRAAINELIETVSVMLHMLRYDLAVYSNTTIDVVFSRSTYQYTREMQEINSGLARVCNFVSLTSGKQVCWFCRTPMTETGPIPPCAYTYPDQVLTDMYNILQTIANIISKDFSLRGHIKKVRLENVKLRVSAYLETADEIMDIDKGVAMFVDEEGTMEIKVDGEYMYVRDLPEALMYVTITLPNDPSVKAIIKTQDKVYLAFSDGEYAHIIPIDIAILQDLLRE